MSSNYSNEGDLIFLSNGYTSALESGGSVVWFPCVRFDSPSIFTKLLDKEVGGEFAIAPTEKYELETSYVQNSLIVKNTFKTAKGVLEILDFLPQHSPSIIRIFDSKVEFTVRVTPKFYYGKIGPRVLRKEHGLIFKNPHSKEAVELIINGNYKLDNDNTIKVQPGKGYIIASYTKDVIYASLYNNFNFSEIHPYMAYIATLNHWNSLVAMAKPVKEFKEAYDRSVAVAMGLMYEQSGAIIAAPTTSLPEIAGESRNWDYRYTWIRDASYAAGALSGVKLTNSAKLILNFLLSVADPLQGTFKHPLYTVDGTEASEESFLGWLKGYKNSRPVRVGNAAFTQIQHDTEGAFFDALFVYLKHTNDITFIMQNWDMIESIANNVEMVWDTKSTSIWEEREEPRDYVHTKVTEWVALDRASQIASLVGKKERAAQWKKTSDVIKASVLANGVSRDGGYFVKSYGSDDVDGALLLLPIYNFVEADDPRFIATLAKIEKDLMVEEGLVLRYKSDFLGNARHPFLLLSTWLARDYIRLGEREKAKRTIQKLINCSTVNMLFAEHFDQKTKELRGNFPQLFPHAGLIEAISEYEDMKQKRFR